jgi:hypothetical protein
MLGLQGNPLLGKLRWSLIKKLILIYFLQIQIKSHNIYRVPWRPRMAFLGFEVPARPISHFEKGELKQLNAKQDLNRREKPQKCVLEGGLENGRFALSLGRTESLPRQPRPQNPAGRCLFNSICMLGLQGNPLLGSWYIGFKSPKIVVFGVFSPTGEVHH